MIRVGKLLISLLYWVGILTSCTENNGSATSDTSANAPIQQATDTFVVEPEAQAGDLNELFTFHQKLNVQDMTFHVLGLGTMASGNYLIIKSSNDGKKFTSITGDKKGRIVQAYATDMDADKQVEIIISIKSLEDHKGTLVIHEIDSLDNQSKITLPELTSNFLEGYQGQDSFFVKGNKIIREILVSTKDAGKTGKRSIEYVLKNNTLLPSAQGGQN
jgi:hypothetical protein